MISKEELKVLKLKATENFISKYEKENKELLNIVELGMIESAKSLKSCFEFDVEDYKKGIFNISELQKYLEIKGYKSVYNIVKLFIHF